MLKSSRIGFVKLHRHHAAPQATRVQFGEPISQTWRGDGGNPDLKAAIAYRLAVCWNVCEGIPTSQLEEGVLIELLDAVADGNLRRAQSLLAKMDRGFDETDGRFHDCEPCLEDEIRGERKRRKSVEVAQTELAL